MRPLPLLTFSFVFSFFLSSKLSAQTPLTNIKEDCPVDTISAVSLKDGDTRLNSFNRPTHIEFADSMAISVPKSGFYKVTGLVNFDSGNKQLNESFFTFVRNQNDGGRITYPLDPNTSLPGKAQYRVVEDNTIDADNSEYRHLGYFYLKAGVDTLVIYHYGRISNLDPTFLNCGTPGPPADTLNCVIRDGKVVMRGFQSVHVRGFVVAYAGYDLAVSQSIISDTSISVSGKTFPAVVAGDTFSYQIDIQNRTDNTTRNFTLETAIPKMITPIFGNLEPSSRQAVGDDSLFTWRFNSLPGGATESILFQAIAADAPLNFPFPVQSMSEVSARCDTLASNDKASALLYIIKPPEPLVYDLAHSQSASVDSVVAGGSFEYTLSVINVGEIDAGNFTVSDTLPAVLQPGFARQPDQRSLAGTDSVFVWNFDQPGDSLLVGDTFLMSIIIAVPQFGQGESLPLLSRSGVLDPKDQDLSNNFASTNVIAFAPPPILESYLDRNVFEPGLLPTIGVNFGLRRGNDVEINVHDLSGTLIKNLANQYYAPGQHRVEWNGVAESGQNAGSGFYVITVRTTDMVFYKKLFLVR
ncbi:MAG: hypothetical protein H6695_01235 [Deferribacteres bacterium]|nr:hypothetical protein [Deferribacteres bacterium]